MQITEENKLGLALSGGGFRAALFHLGVLHRLAELDLLRQVRVLSTVSGGSIIGALYYLLLAGVARRQGGIQSLTAADYSMTIARLKDLFFAGVSKNLRNCLPVDDSPLGKQMANLYSRHFYEEAAKELGFTSGTVPIVVTGIPPDASGVQAHARLRAPGMPKFVINAACLNTGREFRFSLDDVGDVSLGLMPLDKLDELLWMNERIRNWQRPEDQPSREPGDLQGLRLDWWLWVEGLELHNAGDMLFGSDDTSEERNFEVSLSNTPSKVRATFDVLDHLGAVVSEGDAQDFEPPRRTYAMVLCRADLSALHRCRIAARQVNAGRYPYGPEVDAEHRFWRSLDDVDPLLSRQMGDRRPLSWSRDHFEALRDLIEGVYAFRTAHAIDLDAKTALETLSLSDAVAASANFPPVFPAYVVEGLYDRFRFERFGLTDGGMYDNQGLAVLREEGCTHLIVSDGGLQLAEESLSPKWLRLDFFWRIADMLTHHLRAWQLDAMRVQPLMQSVGGRAMAKAGAWDAKDVAFFHLGINPAEIDRADSNGVYPSPLSPRALAPHPFAQEIARLRTDLDDFSASERYALMYQGYQLSDRFVRRHLTGLLPHHSTPSVGRPADWQAPPSVGTDDWTAVQSSLAAGARRQVRKLAIFGRAAKNVPASQVKRISVQAKKGLVDGIGSVSTRAKTALKNLGAASKRLAKKLGGVFKRRK